MLPLTGQSGSIFFYVHTKASDKPLQGVSVKGNAIVFLANTIQMFFYEYNGVMRMKEDKKESPKKKEQLSEKDIKELMNINMPTYKRGKGGAIRNK